VCPFDFYCKTIVINHNGLKKIRINETFVAFCRGYSF